VTPYKFSGWKIMSPAQSKCPSFAQDQFPEEDPHWDPNDDRDYQWLEQYREALFGGMKEEGKKSQEHV
jgi:hypothetical protein